MPGALPLTGMDLTEIKDSFVTIPFRSRSASDEKRGAPRRKRGCIAAGFSRGTH